MKPVGIPRKSVGIPKTAGKEINCGKMTVDLEERNQRKEAREKKPDPQKTI